MEVVVNLVVDSGETRKADVIGTTEELAMVDKCTEKRDVVEEPKEDASDTPKEADMAYIPEETKEDKENCGVTDAGVDVPGVNKELETKIEVVEDSGKAVETDITETMEGPAMGYKDLEKRDVVEETKEEAPDTVEAAETAYMSDQTKEAAFGTEEEAEMADMVENKVEVEEEEVAEEVEEEKEVMAEEVTSTEEMEAADQTEMSENAEETKMPEETEEDVNEAGDMDEVGITDRTEENEKEEDMDATNAKEESEMAEEAENGEEMELADGTEVEGVGDEVEEVSRNAGGKRKRGKNAKASARVSTRKKLEEDVCFICFDGGNLFLCDRR